MFSVHNTMIIVRGYNQGESTDSTGVYIINANVPVLMVKQPNMIYYSPLVYIKNVCVATFSPLFTA